MDEKHSTRITVRKKGRKGYRHSGVIGGEGHEAARQVRQPPGALCVIAKAVTQVTGYGVQNDKLRLRTASCANFDKAPIGNLLLLMRHDSPTCDNQVNLRSGGYFSSRLLHTTAHLNTVAK